MSDRRKEVFTLPEGKAVLLWPCPMTAQSYEFFKEWLQVLLKKVAASTQCAK